MFQAGVTRPLRARHALANASPEESVPHSHPYRVELICSSRTIDENGYSTDIAAMESALEHVLAAIDDVFLNDLPWFADRPPSLENLACYLAETLRSELSSRGAEPAEPLELRIWENEFAWAGYREER